MKKPTQLAFLLSITIVIGGILSGCSKEKRTERSLTKKEGEWNIDEMTYDLVVQGASASSIGQNVYSGQVTTNAGTFIFSKDKITIVYNINDTTYTSEYSWNMDEDSIRISYIKNSIDFSGNFDQAVVDYAGAEIDKDKLTFKGEETKQQGTSSNSNVNQFVLVVESMQLSRK